MIRKSIRPLDEMPDEEMFQKGSRPADIQKRLHDSLGLGAWFQTEKDRRKTRLFANLAVLTKQFINEGVAFEALITEQGLRNVSAAIWALEWRELYYIAEAENSKRHSRGYWRCLWDALLGR